jgi:ATP-dependent Clp protease ATP-binding subunit ClpA
MHRALAYARQRKHQYATLEHLLLALIDDVDASAAIKACKIDHGALKELLTNYVAPVCSGAQRRFDVVRL